MTKHLDQLAASIKAALADAQAARPEAPSMTKEDAFAAAIMGEQPEVLREVLSEWTNTHEPEEWIMARIYAENKHRFRGRQ